MRMSMREFYNETDPLRFWQPNPKLPFGKSLGIFSGPYSALNACAKQSVRQAYDDDRMMARAYHPHVPHLKAAAHRLQVTA